MKQLTIPEDTGYAKVIVGDGAEATIDLVRTNNRIAEIQHHHAGDVEATNESLAAYFQEILSIPKPSHAMVGVIVAHVVEAHAELVGKPEPAQNSTPLPA